MSKGRSTQTQLSEPWGPAQIPLQNVLGRAADLYGSGQLGGVADFTPAQQQAFQNIANRASTPGVADTATQTITSLMNPAQYREGLEGVRQDVLGSAIPAAAAQFSGAGLTDSSVAQQGVGRAAAQALAPVEYGAFQQAQNRALTAATAAPSIQAAQYMPSQLLAGIGAQQQLLNQQRIDSPYQTLQRYGDIVTGIGGLGGQGSQSERQRVGLFSILGAGLRAAPFLKTLSDRRLKRNIRKVGVTDKGHNLYEFNYLWNNEPHIGVMADEVPHAIAGKIGPYSVVDYGKVL